MAITPDSLEFNILLISRIVLIISIVLFSIYLGRMIIFKRKKIGYLEFDFIFSIFVFMVCTFIYNVLSFYFDFYLTKFDADKYYIMPNIIFWRIFSFFLAFGLLTILFTIEWKVLYFKLKGVPCAILIGLILLFLFYPVNSAEDFKFVLFITSIAATVSILIVIIFIYVGFKTPALRKTSFSIALGIIIYAIGTQIANETFIDPLRELYGPNIQIIFYIFNTIFQILGLFLTSYGMSHFSYAPGVSKHKPVNKTQYSAKAGFEEDSKTSLYETLSYSRPAEITEKEVSIYREQNVCLVCKGELGRYSVYLCPKCNVLYCESCARTLSELENMCWVCSEPIDESKPVRPFKRDKEEIIIKSSEKNPKKQKTDKISSKK